jgi:hypothetical protein
MQNQKRPTAFKMAAAAMFEIQVNAIKWGIIPSDFDENWYTDYEKHAEFRNHKNGGVGQFSRWPPPPVC